MGDERRLWRLWWLPSGRFVQVGLPLSGGLFVLLLLPLGRLGEAREVQRKLSLRVALTLTRSQKANFWIDPGSSEGGWQW